MSHCHQGDKASHLTQHPAKDLLLKPDAQAKFCFACASGFEVRVRYFDGVAFTQKRIRMWPNAREVFHADKRHNLDSMRRGD